MTVSKTKTYQYVMTEDECQLFNLLRRCESESIDLIAPKDHPRLSQPFNLSLDVDGRRLRRYVVDAHQVVQETASKAAEYLREVLSDDFIVDEPNPSIETGGIDHHPSNGGPNNSDDRDSVLGTQTVIKEPDNEQNSPKDLPWQTFRERYVPPSVNVTFHIDDLNVDLESDLRKRFPGVDFTRSPTRQLDPEQDAVDSSRQPKGVKSMAIELDEEDVAYNPAVERQIRKQYPWATFHTKASPNSSKKRRPPLSGQDATYSQKFDAVKHLCDFAELASEPPTTQEFELYNSQVHEEWDTLEFRQKVDIAHARAIQSHYGKVVDGGGCGHCIQEGYKCKAYAPELHQVSTMDLGYSCQNCRLKGTICDLSPVGSDPKVLRLDTKESTITRPRDAATTPSRTAANKRSLASRMSISENDLAETPSSPSITSPILQFAERIGIHVNHQVGRVIHAMYLHLRQHREIRPYGARTSNLEHYYSNLVTLYILAFKQGEFDLAYIVLLRFQNTNYSRTGALPGVELAVRAFEYLPQDSGLCQWLAVLYSFLWGTQNEGEYDQFTTYHSNLDTLALSKLMYAVAYVRDPFTEGHDFAVLLRWCSVHDHAEGSEEQRLCERSQLGLKMDLETATKTEKARILADAQRTVEEYGGEAGFNGRIEVLSQSSPVHKGKRKAEISPARSFRKIKRGGGYGQGR
ncbi:hypothetical protein CC86DRAFT_341125 [Ophiobolus disseminans]|uniref:Uncharacterized protein n=1 Tax=Ophiobolus disseminans TaxID=1469910 RepID=A0A6A7AH46_9PLEO|nr:hypothetical protein CC86DRAFT_341125 [Ophiobolus disseminans]